MSKVPRQLSPLVILLLLLSSLLFLGGCNGGTETGNPSATRLFASDAELEGYLKTQYAANVLAVPNSFAGDEATSGAPTDSLAPAGAGGETAREHSTTNVQETGVDESDKVKTDGNYLYVAGTDVVTIVQIGADASMTDVGVVDVPGTVDSLYLRGDVLAVLYRPQGGEGNRWDGAVGVPELGVAMGMPCWIPVQAQTGVLLIDVENPAAPSRLKNWVFDGNLISSRLVGSQLHVIQQFLPNLPRLQIYYDETTENKDAVVKANLEKLEPLALSELTPSYQLLDEQGNSLQTGHLVAGEDFQRPEEPQGATIVAVASLDLEQPERDYRAVGAVLDAHLLYASTKALYLVSHSYDNSGGQHANIHKFSLDGAKVSFAASGKAPGYVKNQFSLGEHEGVLRVATSTGSQWWGDALRNNVYCLKAEGESLEIIGRLENLAPGESIYAARFMGDRGYLVTFVKVDPLFTLDLSDPTAPQVVGELKVPGYSDYIHPLGEDFLLTIGKDTTLQEGTAWYQGVQLSIFDVSDFANPALLHTEIIGDRGTHSEALYHHKAFTFWPQNDLLAIPVDLYQHQSPPAKARDWGQHTFSGLYVYRATSASGFELLGRIDTALNLEAPQQRPSWTRGLFIDSNVFAVTSAAVQSANVDDVESTVKTLAIGQ